MVSRTNATETYMVDPPPSPGIGDPEAPTRRSRWVRVLAIAVAVILIALLVVLHLTGTFGPGAH